MPRNLPDIPQKLFITYDVCSLILSLPIGNEHKFIMTETNNTTSDPTEENASKSHSQHVNVPQRAYDNLHKRPPPGIHNSVADAVKHWLNEGHDETLKVNSPARTRRKVWMGKGV